jgi:hypothetical protein
MEKKTKKLWELMEEESGWVGCVDCIFQHLQVAFANQDVFGEHAECGEHFCMGCDVRLTV